MNIILSTTLKYPYECKICHCIIHSNKSLVYHIKQKHAYKEKDYYDQFIKNPQEGLCLTCGSVTKFISIKKGYNKFCSNKCIRLNEDIKQKSKQTCLKKFGYENPSNSPEIKAQKKATCLKHYGTINPSQANIIKQKKKKTFNIDKDKKLFIMNEKKKKTSLLNYSVRHPMQSDIIKKKLENTFIKKYGVKNPNQLSITQEKTKRTCLKKYGSSTFLQTPEFKIKSKETCLKKYGVENYMQLPYFKQAISKKLHNFYYEKLISRLKPNIEPLFDRIDYNGSQQYKKYLWLCKKCNNTFLDYVCNGHGPKCPICNPTRSQFESDIRKFIKELLPDEVVLFNDIQTISPYELDILIPSRNLAIELNGNFWHSELNLFSPKTRQYHTKKTDLCHSKKIRLIHIFEDEWSHSPQIVKSRLKHICNKTNYSLYGRQCIVQEIDHKLKTVFLNKYHLQFSCLSSINLGCFYKNKLIAVMSFGKRKISKSQTSLWELIRYATISNFNCVGVASKLFKYFERKYQPTQIISYADRRWSEGNLYYKLGFTLDHISSPNYWYMHKSNYLKRMHRYNFRKSTLKKLKIFNPNLSEWENMKNNGYDRIWDCGNYVFTKTSIGF